MDPCKDEAPQVIDEAMIQKCIQDLFPKGEAGKLTREEGIPLDEVQEIRIEFLRIIRIDHLWPMTALTRLSLSNNLIEKIENLDQLVNLVELDLSFNKISKLENLEKLEKIETFSIFENLITKIENINAFKNLAIISLGKNFIESVDDVLYMRRFRKLKSLNMAGNPCTKESNFRLFVATFLPQITYYEYVMVQPSERSIGAELYKTKMEEVIEMESEQRDREMREEKEAAEAALYEDSFVEFLGTNYLFESMFEHDHEGKAMLLIGEEMEEYYAEFSNLFFDVTQQIFKTGQEQYAIRKTEVDQFMKCVETAKLKNQQESIEIMETFLEEKRKDIKLIEELQELADNGDIAIEDYQEKVKYLLDDFYVRQQAVWKKLMQLEITLFEQMEESNSTFEHTMTEMINVFLEAAQGYFSQLRVLETTYMENLTESANRYRTNFNMNDDIEVPPGLAPYILLKEDLNNALAATHDMHLQIIDAREDRLVTKAKGWLCKLVNNLQHDEIARSRMKILDINHFLDLQKEEYEAISNVQVGIPIDPDAL